MALILCRRAGEEIKIKFKDDMTSEQLEQLLSEGMTVRVVYARLGQAKLAFIAPRGVAILRAELLERDAISEA